MTPAGTSNELDVQNGWEENTHTHTSNREVTTHSLHYQRLSKFQAEIISCPVQIREGTRIALQFKTPSLRQGIENSPPITSSPMNLVTINNRSDQPLEQIMMDETSIPGRLRVVTQNSHHAYIRTDYRWSVVFTLGFSPAQYDDDDEMMMMMGGDDDDDDDR